MPAFIFQARFGRFPDLEAKGERSLLRWPVKQHVHKIQIGDLAYLWMAGEPEERGIYGVARVEDVTRRGDGRDYAQLRVESRVDPPLLASEIRRDPVLRHLTILR